MFGRKTVGIAAAAIVALAIATTLAAAPVRLPRHPDYHAGKITFSYLGDIWTANEDGSGVASASPTTSRARSTRGSRPTASGSRSPRTATATTTSSSSLPAGGAPKRLTYHTGNDEVVGWTRDSQNVIFRAARGDGAFPNVAVLYQIPATGGMEKAAAGRLGLLGQLLARRQVAGLQPPSRGLVAPALPRQLRGRPLGREPRRQVPTPSSSATSSTTATGRCGAPTTRSTSSATRCPTTRA